MEASYGWKTGEVRTYVRTVEVEGGNAAGSSGTMRSEITARESTLEFIPRGGALNDVDLERVVVEMRRGGSDAVHRFDSATDSPSAVDPDAVTFSRMTLPLRAMAGGRLRVKFQPSGAVESIEGIEALKEKVLAALPPGEEARRAADGTANLLFLRYLLIPQILLPGKRMEPGESRAFLDTRFLPPTSGVPGLLFYSGRYRLDEVKEGKARWSLQADVALDSFPGQGPSPPQYASFRPMLRLVSGSCRATATVNVETGALEESEHVTELDLWFTPPDGSGEVHVPTKVTQTILRKP